MDENTTITTDQPVVNITIPVDTPGVLSTQTTQTKNEAVTQELSTESKENVDSVITPESSVVQSATLNEIELVCLHCQIKFMRLEDLQTHVASHPLSSSPIEQKPKHAGGRPCEFCQRKDEMLQITREYINTGKGDKPRMVFINELAMNLGYYRDIIIEWKKKVKDDGSLEHPEFADMIKELESMQELRLQQRLLGRFNPTGAIFLLKTKHKYIETDKQILAGDKSEPLQITIVEEDRHVADN